jgi:DNA-binding NarL/FixJ family response regulator
MRAGCVGLLEQAVDCSRLKHNYPQVEFIGLVGFDTQHQRFVLLELDHEIKHPPDGGQLSGREREVLQWVALGCTNLQIARRLAIAENTVKTHLQNIFAKLKVQSRTEAAMWAVQRGWVVE